jgi:hypothetical protein
MFCTGQKVVCCDDVFHPQIAALYLALPKKDAVYVVRSVSVGISPTGDEGEIAITLTGLKNPRSSKPPHPERAFNAMRFRSLEEMQGKVSDEAEHKEYDLI